MSYKQEGARHGVSELSGPMAAMLSSRRERGRNPTTQGALCPRVTIPELQEKPVTPVRPAFFSPACLLEPVRGKRGVAAHAKTPGEPAAPATEEATALCPRPGRLEDAKPGVRGSAHRAAQVTRRGCSRCSRRRRRGSPSLGGLLKRLTRRALANRSTAGEQVR
jgi:hypothetical protein